jgi:membrane protein DedA with SNARE-associated domain
VNSFLENWGYLAIFVLTLLESACIPIPSEVTLGLSGALASGAVISGLHGDLNLGWIIVVGTLGSVVGSVIAYWVGRTGGRAFVDRFGRYVLLTHRDLDRAEAWFDGRGEWAVLVGRVLPVVRTFISLPAGLAEMNLAKFVAFTTVGVAAWVSLLSTIGYVAGPSWNTVTKGFSDATYVVAGLAVVAGTVLVVLRIRSMRAERRSDTEVCSDAEVKDSGHSYTEHAHSRSRTD